MPSHPTTIFTLAHLLPLSIAHLPQQKTPFKLAILYNNNIADAHPSFLLEEAILYQLWSKFLTATLRGVIGGYNSVYIVKYGISFVVCFYLMTLSQTGGGILYHPWAIGKIAQIAKFMGPTWGPPGSCRPQMGPMLAPWTLPSGRIFPRNSS